MQRRTAHDLIVAQTWAMTPDWLEMLSTIALRENETIEAVEAKIGRPLEHTETATMRGTTAVIPIVGPIFRRANLFTRVSGATSTELLAKEIEAAANNDKVEAIVLNIDSPGGQATGIAELASQIDAVQKPVIAYVDGSAASAAYWLASAADRIVLSKTAEVGSIGAVIAYDTAKDKTTREIVSSQSPKKRPDLSTSEGISQLQARIDAMAQVFIEDVATYRGVSVETVMADFGQGDMVMGEAAVAKGMADEVSTIEQLLASLAGPSKRGNHMNANEITREWLATNCPAIVSAIEADARQDGISAERERIAAIDAAALPGHEELIASMKADGTAASDAALKVIAAEKAKLSAAATHLEQSAPAPVAFAAADNGISADLPLDERCQQQWESDKAIRAEFGTLEAFKSFTRASESGRARIKK